MDKRLKMFQVHQQHGKPKRHGWRSSLCQTLLPAWQVEHVVMGKCFGVWQIWVQALILLVVSHTTSGKCQLFVLITKYLVQAEFIKKRAILSSQFGRQKVKTVWHSFLQGLPCHEAASPSGAWPRCSAHDSQSTQLKTGSQKSCSAKVTSKGSGPNDL